LPASRDCAGKTASDIASELQSEKAREEMKLLFLNYQNFATTRGGLGDAFRTAIADNRPVVEVEWYTLPLPVLVAVGGRHSLIKIFVKGQDANGRDGEESYVIEKAEEVPDALKVSEDNFKNGTYVSYWRDVQPNIPDKPLCTLRKVKPRITVRELRDLVARKPYNVAHYNCHHAAMELHNHSAADPDDMLKELPVNRGLTKLAQAVEFVGIDVAAWRSESAGVTSQMKGDQPSLFEKEKTIAAAFEDGTLKGEDNPKVVQAWPAIRDAAAPTRFLKPTEYERKKPLAKRTGIYGGYFSNVRCELIVFLTIMAPEEMQTDANGEPWPAWYTEHLKVAKLKKAQKVKEGAMKENQRFVFLLGINTEEGLPKVSSCANTEIGEAGEGRRLSRKQLENFHDMWKSIYGTC